MKKIYIILALLIIATPALARKARIRPSERAVFHNNQGISFMNQNQPEKAEFEFKTALELAPEYQEAFNNLGIIAKLKGRLDEALTYFKRAILIDKNYSSPYNHIGTIYLDRKEPDKAIKWIQKAIKKEPTFADAYYNLALCYLEKTKKNPVKSYVKFAEAYFKKATELNPKLKLVHTELAQMYRDIGDYEHAVIRYRLALEDDPADIETWIKTGNLYLTMKEPFKAQNAFLKAVEANPNSAEVHQALALFYYNEGRYDEAMTEFSEVTRLAPISEIAYFRLGTIKLAIGDQKKQEGDMTAAAGYYADAEGNINRALQINPSFVDASYNLGLAYLKQGKTEEAKKQWKHTLILEPNNPRTLYNLGNLYNYLNDKQNALEMLCKFISVGVKDFTAEIETAKKVVAAGGGCP
ncbi:MAG: hypothetical protein COV46_02335 [Deltaproteobacteria bacterium CG11_big_fil_rev_8_21_14_0_20_49_13]|nr:MAG: hypothetical protein COV46_02335 [Deltaproteobacteria bacterium CG11_big_fil_rev_8_21_14_0_20_49_13]